MSPEQFVFWLRGYMASSGPAICTKGDWKAIEAVLKTVNSPIEDAAWLEEARARLRREKEEYLRTLPPAVPYTAPPMPVWPSQPGTPPPFTVTCSTEGNAT